MLLGGRCYSVVDEKPKRSTRLQRLRNIEEHHAATLLCDVYSDDWERLAWAMLRCHAEVLDEGDDAYAEALGALRAKYPQYREMALDGRPLVALTPQRVSSWGIEGRYAVSERRPSAPPRWRRWRTRSSPAAPARASSSGASG